MAGSNTALNSARGNKSNGSTRSRRSGRNGGTSKGGATTPTSSLPAATLFVPSSSFTSPSSSSRTSRGYFDLTRSFRVSLKGLGAFIAESQLPHLKLKNDDGVGLRLIGGFGHRFAAGPMKRRGNGAFHSHNAGGSYAAAFTLRRRENAAIGLRQSVSN